MIGDLALRLLRCESEGDVTALVSSVVDDYSWLPLDGRETNFNVVTNQAASGAKALTELCTNMVDAILMRHAAQRGIDPRSADAPRSVIDGVKQLVRLKGARSGILAEVDDAAYLREYAEKNLVIGVTGSDGAKPNFTFVDSGEGQSPDNFPDTFLSLSSGRKKEIPFVQGKYNMGSSGVLSYCGRCWYKLILSRRFDGDHPWGWTLLRRRPGGGMPIAEYLVSSDGKIPVYRGSEIRPFVRQDGEIDEKVSRCDGTIIKLYGYVFGLPPNFRRIREALDENLVSTILPFRLMDFRVRPDRRRGGRRALGVDERTLKGMEYQLRGIEDPEDEASTETVDEVIHVASVEHRDLGTLRVEAIPLPVEVPGWLRRNVNRVYHAVNGQVQYKQTRGFISRNCRRPGLKDRVVVLVDASGLTEAAHNDVWKGDRETIRQTEVGSLYVQSVETAIRDSAALRELERRIAEEETKRIAKEAQSDLFDSLVSSDPHIAQLLPGGTIVTLPKRGSFPARGRKEYEGRYSPTHVKLGAASLREQGIDVGRDESRRVRFDTDAANDWLTRPDNRGAVRLEGPAKSVVSCAANLRDGRLTLTFRLVERESVARGEFAGVVVLEDDAMPVPVQDSFTIKVVNERRKRQSSGTTPKPPVGDRDEKAVADQKGVPPTEWLTSDGRTVDGQPTVKWPDDFTEQDGGWVKDLDASTKVFQINYDNAHFQHFVRPARREALRNAIVEQYRLSMLVLMMGFEYAYEKSQVRVHLEESVEEIRRVFAQGAANVVMSIARTVPRVLGREFDDPDD